MKSCLTPKLKYLSTTNKGLGLGLQAHYNTKMFILLISFFLRILSVLLFFFYQLQIPTEQLQML